MNDQLRVGLVGANMGRGWASYTHLPALAALPGVRLAAACTTSLESARATADHFGADHAFDKVEDLVAAPDINLVAVSVKAPLHFATVSAAIRAGKPVLCEWPLGRSIEESRALLGLAREAGVPNFLVMQGRKSAPLRHAAALIADGYLGDILSVDLLSTHAHWGVEMPEAARYLLDAENGATIPNIIGGHSLDMLLNLAGPFDLLHGLIATRYRSTRISGTDEVIDKTSPDQFLAQGRLDGGAPVSIHIQGGTCGGDRFALTVWGSRGTLRLEADNVPEVLPPRLSGTQDSGQPLAPIPVPAALWSVPDVLWAGPAANVAEIYQGVAAALRGGLLTVPDFAHGVRVKEMLAVAVTLP